MSRSSQATPTCSDTDCGVVLNLRPLHGSGRTELLSIGGQLVLRVVHTNDPDGYPDVITDLLLDDLLASMKAVVPNH